MVDISKLFNIKEAISISSKNLPKHVATTVEGSVAFAENNKVAVNEQLKTDYSLVRKITIVGSRLKIPVLTFLILPEQMKDSSHFSTIMDTMGQFFTELSDWEYLEKHQVKVSVLGKWYDLPGRVVEPIKEVIDETKDYDGFFLNFCVNYDGQEEIVDACQLLARQVKADKLDPESISKETIRENIYSSYFIPPDLIIETRKKKRLRGVLLWDSVNSVVYFAGKPWPEFKKTDFLRAVEFYQKQGF